MKAMRFFIFVCFLFVVQALNSVQARNEDVSAATYAQCDEGRGKAKGVFAYQPCPDDIPWRDGCDERGVELLQPTAQLVDYAGACELYRQCDPDGYGLPICQLRAFKYMRDGCLEGDKHCENTALLYTAAIYTLDPQRINFCCLDNAPDSWILGNLPHALTTFQEYNFDLSLALYGEIYSDDFLNDLQVSFAFGLVRQMMGEPELALDHYERAFAWQSVQPLVWYARSQVLGELGRVDEASFDVASLFEIVKDVPDLIPLVAPLLEQFPLDPSVMSDWLYYPVLSFTGSVGGSTTLDLSLEQPRSVRLSYYEDLEVIIATGFWRKTLLDQTSILLVTRFDLQSDGIFYSYATYNRGINLLRLEEGLIAGLEYGEVFEASGETSFLLASETRADPRLNNSIGVRYCDQSVITRIELGAEISFGDEFRDGIVYDMPNGDAIAEGRRAIVLDGPVCVENQTWWQVELSNGVVGWATENIENSYMVGPVSSRSWMSFCWTPYSCISFYELIPYR